MGGGILYLGGVCGVKFCGVYCGFFLFGEIIRLLVLMCCSFVFDLSNEFLK